MEQVVSLLIKQNTGSIGLFSIKEDPKVNLGNCRQVYTLKAELFLLDCIQVVRSFQGKGYGTECITAILIEHPKSNYGVVQIKAWIDTRNLYLPQLVERIGMTQVEFIEKERSF